MKNVWVVGAIALVLGGCAGSMFGVAVGGVGSAGAGAAEYEERIAALEQERDDLLSAQARSEAAPTAEELAEVEDERDGLQVQLDAAKADLAEAESRLDSIEAAQAAEEAEAAANTFSDGVFLVGTDMPAGRYRGTVVGGNPYWKISSDPNGSDIVENALPNGPFYVEVREGQYLELQDVEISPAE